MSSLRVRTVLVLSLLLVAPGCSKSPPRLTLQQVMFQVESELGKTKAMVEAGDMAGVQTHVGELRRWWENPAHDLYFASGKITRDREAFLGIRGELSSALDRLEAAARAGDEKSVRAENATLRSTCDRCHIAFRPLVTKRYGQ